MQIWWPIGRSIANYDSVSISQMASCSYFRLHSFLCILTLTSILPAKSSAKYLHVKFLESNEIICEATGEPLDGDDVQRGLSKPMRAVVIPRSHKTSPPTNEKTKNENDANGNNKEGRWAAVLDVVDNLGTVKQTSILEEVKNAFLLGASAVVLLAMNSNYLRKFQFDKAFAKPVVVISTNITRILKALSRSTTIQMVASWYEAATKEKTHFSELTLWSTCGRMSAMGYFPWEGTICMEPEDGKANQDLFWAVYYAIILFLCLLLHLKTRRVDIEDETDGTSGRCRQLAVRRLKKMGCVKYKRRESYSPSAGSGNREHGQTDSCAICLDDYRRNQTIRVLPCSHHFHSLCVDGWLVDHQTCPLCIVNVFDLMPK